MIGPVHKGIHTLGSLLYGFQHYPPHVIPCRVLPALACHISVEPRISHNGETIRFEYIQYISVYR